MPLLTDLLNYAVNNRFMYNGQADPNAHAELSPGGTGEMFNGSFKEMPSSTGGNNGYYLATPNQAQRFRPNINPVRLPFNGIVNFYLNPSVATFTADTRNGLSSLVKTASLPSFELKTDVKNQYNKKRVTVSGVEYKPLEISVYDTVDSAWMSMIMKSYSHYMNNPMGKYEGSQSGSAGVPQENGKPIKLGYDVVPDKFTSGDSAANQGTSSFNQVWDENNNGLNIRAGNDKNLFTHVDIILYHAQRHIRFTVFNPVITTFQSTSLDYASSQPMEISMTLDYETFSMDPIVNNYLPEDDMKRFSNFSEGIWKQIREGGEITAYSGILHMPANSTAKQNALKPYVQDHLSTANVSASVNGSRRTKQDQAFWGNFKP